METTIMYLCELSLDVELHSVDKEFVSFRVYKDNKYFDDALKLFIENKENVSFSKTHIFVIVKRSKIELFY